MVEDVIFTINDDTDNFLLDIQYINKEDFIDVNIVCPYTNAVKDHFKLAKSAFTNSEAEQKIKESVLNIVSVDGGARIEIVMQIGKQIDELKEYPWFIKHIDNKTIITEDGRELFEWYGHVVPQGYKTNNDGIYKEVFNKSSEDYEYIQITTTPSIITGVGHDIDNKEYWLEVTLKDVFGKTHSVWDSQKNVFSKDGIRNLIGKGLNITDLKHGEVSTYLTKCLSANNKRLMQHTVSSRNGWKEDYSYFVLGDKGYYPDKQLDVKLIDPDIKNHYIKGGSLYKWVEGVIDVLEYDVVRMCFYSFLTPVILGLVDGDSFIFHNVGGSGEGKTIRMLCAASVLGNPRKLRVSAKSTPLGFIKYNQINQHLPMFVDEISEAPNFKKNVYSLVNGNTRYTSNSDGGTRETDQYPTVVCTTGEREIVDDNAYEGEYVRVINITDRIPPGNHELVESAKTAVIKNYGHFFDLFIEEVHRRKDELREEYLKYHSAFPEIKSQQIDRIKGNFSSIAVAGAIVEDIFERIGIPKKDSFKIVSKYLISNVKDNPIEKFHIKVLRKSYDWYLKHNDHFIHETEDFEDNPEDSETKKITNITYGWESAEYIDIIPDVLKDYFNKEGLEISQAIKSWKNDGIIMTSGEKRNTYKATKVIKGKGKRRVNVIRIHKQQLAYNLGLVESFEFEEGHKQDEARIKINNVNHIIQMRENLISFVNFQYKRDDLHIPNKIHDISVDFMKTYNDMNYEISEVKEVLTRMANNI